MSEAYLPAARCRRRCRGVLLDRPHPQQLDSRDPARLTPLALLTKAIEERLRPGMRIGRMTLDILGAIPVSEVRVRPGWTGRAIASACCRRRWSPTGRWPASAPGPWRPRTPPMPPPTATRHWSKARRLPLELAWKDAGGYIDSVQWRPQSGTPPQRSTGCALGRPGRRRADHRPAAPGHGGRFGQRRWRGDRPGPVRVHEHRHRSASASVTDRRDFALRARGSIGPDGVGVTTADLFDRAGFVGTSAQTLLVQRR